MPTLTEAVTALESRFASVVQFDEKQPDFARAPNGQLYRQYFNGLPKQEVGAGGIPNGGITTTPEEAVQQFVANVADWEITEGATLYWRGKPELYADERQLKNGSAVARYTIGCRCAW